MVQMTVERKHDADFVKCCVWMQAEVWFVSRRIWTA